jgi:hypothetical protein
MTVLTLVLHCPSTEIGSAGRIYRRKDRRSMICQPTNGLIGKHQGAGNHWYLNVGCGVAA